MVETAANLQLKGSGNLNKFIEDLNKQMGSLNKVTKEQEKGFEKLNKTGSETAVFSEKLLNSVRDLGGATGKLTKGSRDTLTFLKDTGKATILLNDHLYEATKGLSGFGLSAIGLKDDTQRLNAVISQPASHFRDIAQAQGATAKAFVILDKTSKPIVGTLNALSNQVEKFEKGVRNSEQFVASFSKTIVGTGAKSLTFFSKTFADIATNLEQSGFLGRIFAKSFEGVSQSLQKSSKNAKAFAKTINPENLKKVDAAGEKLGNTFDTVGKGLDRLSTGVKLADLAGDISRAVSSLKQTASDIGSSIASSVRGTGEAVKIAIPLYTALNTNMQIAAQGAGLLAATTGNQLAGAFSKVAAKLGDLSIKAGAFTAIGSAAADAYVQSKGLNDTFEVMQNMGVDTSAASIAFQFGLVGEKLILSTNAAKEFGKTAISTFAQLEDTAAFVTTIGAGANLQFENLEKGIESISAATVDLSNKLDNAVSSTQTANALYNALSAGIGVASDGTTELAETNQFLSASLKLAAGSGADTAQTLELLAKTSKVYSLSNTDAAQTAAKLYQIVEQGITTFPQLTSGLGRTLSVAKATGVSLDEAAGSIAALTKVTGTAEALQGFASLLQSVAGQGAQAQKAVQELGVRFDVSSIKSNGLINSLNDLYEATGGNASALKEIIPDQLAFQTALQLMTSANKDAAATTKAVADAGEEALDRVFEARQQSTVKQFSQIMNGFNEVLVDFGRRALPAIQPGVDFLQTLLGILQNMPEPLKAVIGSIILFQTSLSNVGGAVLGFVASLGQVIASVIAFRTISLLMNRSLGEEIKIIKALNSNGLNLADTFLRLVGLNNKLTVEGAEVNATLRKQNEIKKQLNKNQLNFEGDISSSRDLRRALQDIDARLIDIQNRKLTNKEAALINFQGDINSAHDLKQALRQVENNISQLSSQELNFDTKNTLQELEVVKSKLEGALNQPINLNKTEKSLRRLRKNIQSTIQLSEGTRGSVLEQFKNDLNKSFSNINISLDQKREILKNNLNRYFATFGEQGKEAASEIDAVFRSVLGDPNLGIEQKLQTLTETFNTQISKLPADARRELGKLEKTFNSSLRLILTGENKNIVEQIGTSLGNITSNADEKISKGLRAAEDALLKGFQKIQTSVNAKVEATNTELDAILENPQAVVDSKVKNINAIFDSLLDKAPKQAEGKLLRLEKEIINGLTGIASAVESSNFDRLNNQLGEISGDSVRDKVQSSLRSLQEKIETGLSSLKSVADDSVEAVNNDVEDIAGPSTRSQVDQNLDRSYQVVDQGLDRIENRAEVSSQQISGSFNKFGRIGNSVAELFGPIAPMLYPITGAIDATGDIIGEFDGKLDVLTKKFKLFGKSSKSVSTASNAMASSLNTVSNASEVLDPKLAKTAKTSGVFTKITGVMSSASAGAAKGFSALGGAAASAGGMLKGLLATAWKFVAALAPFAIAAGAVVGAISLLAGELGRLIPGLGKLYDGSVRNTLALQDFRAELEEQNDTLKRYNEELRKERGFDVNVRPAQNSFEELGKSREALLAELDLQDRAYVQGVRGLIINTTETITQGLVAVLDKATDIGLKGLKIASNIIPFKNVRKQFKNFLDDLSLTGEKASKELRDKTNSLREDVQASITRKERKELNEVRGLLAEQNSIQAKIIEDFQEGTAATATGAKILEEAVREERSLSAKELKELQEAERGRFKELKDQNTQQIAFLQKRIEEAKDPDLIRAYEEEIDKISQRNSELEKSIKLAENYRNNVQALLKNIEQNKAAEGVSRLQDQFENLYNDLGPEAQKRMRETFNPEFLVNPKISFEEVDTAEAETGGLIEPMAKSLGESIASFESQTKVNFEELGIAVESSADRLRAGALLTAQATLTKSIEDLADPSKDVNVDVLSTNLFNTLDAIGEAYPDEAKKLEEIINVTNQEINVDGIETQLKNVLKPKELEGLANQIVEITGNTNERVIKDNKAAITQINSLQASRSISRLEAIEKTNEIEEENNRLILESKKQQLEALEKADMGSTARAKDLSNEVATLEIQNQQKIFENKKRLLDAELDQLKQQKANELKIIENNLTKERELSSLRSEAINIDQSAMKASQELASSITNLQITGLQNRLKFTGDIEEKAQGQLEIAKAQLQALEREQAFEKENLLLQQELNKLALEREEIQLRSTEATIQNNIATTQAKLNQADALKLTEAEIEALELQLASYEDQLDINDKQQTQLEKQGRVQTEINKKQRDSLELKQEAARQTSAAEVELAELEKVLAGYEKQKEIIKNNAKEAEILGDERLQQLESQGDILQSQTDILQQQLDIVKETNGTSQQYFDLAKQNAYGAFQQRRLEKEAAKERLENLKQIQKIEKVNFEIQQQQKELALVRKEIELDIAESKQEAALAEAKAEQAKVEADPRATEEQRRAAALNVRAQETGLAGIQDQRSMLGVERQLLDFSRRQEEIAMGQRQELQRLQAESDLADTTRSRADNARISREARDRGRETADQVESLASEFTRAAEEFQQRDLSSNRQRESSSIMTTVVTRPQRNGVTQQVASRERVQSDQLSQQLSLGGNITVQLNINGNGAAKLDKTELQKVASESLYKGLDELFTYSINKRNNA